MKRHYFLFLTSLLSQIAPTWGMEPDDKFDDKHSQIIVRTETNTNATCSFMDPRGCQNEGLEPQNPMVGLAGAATGNPFDPRRKPQTACIKIEQVDKIQVIEKNENGFKKKIIISEEIDEKILVHLDNFDLSFERRETLWKEFGTLVTTKGIQPFHLTTQDPHFIACGLWRAHHEEAAQGQVDPADKNSLPLRSLLSCLLTDRFALINKTLQPNKVPLLKSLILTNPYFTNLELFKANITDTHLRVLETIPHLKELSLEENDITDNGVMVLMQYPDLLKLNLAKNNITPHGAQILAKSQTLKHLNLYKNPIGDEGAGYLSYNTILEYLDLRETGIGDEGARALALNNKTLKDLRLRYNVITDVGAQAFQNSHHLNSLELARNHISEDLVVSLENLKTGF